MVDSVDSTKLENLTQLFPGKFPTATGGRIEVIITAFPTQGLALGDLCLELILGETGLFG